MTAFDELLKSGSYKYNDKVLKYCGKLFDNFDLNEFWYYKVTNNGHFSYLCSHSGFDEYFSSEKMYLQYPYFRSPCYFHDGVILLETAQDNIISEVIKKAKDFELFNPISIVTKLPEGVEVFGFSSNCSSVLKTAQLLNELPVLKFFMEKFREDNPAIFKSLQDNQINISHLIGPAFYQKHDPKFFHLPNKQRFLQEMGCKFDFSRRENEVIQQLLLGYSAGQIAKILYLSKRTVEHHIERIKMKLNCSSKAELIQKSRELEQIGYFVSEF